jgi:hypothetical protein
MAIQVMVSRVKMWMSVLTTHIRAMRMLIASTLQGATLVSAKTTMAGKVMEIRALTGMPALITRVGKVTAWIYLPLLLATLVTVLWDIRLWKNLAHVRIMMRAGMLHVPSLMGKLPVRICQLLLAEASPATPVRVLQDMKHSWESVRISMVVIIMIVVEHVWMSQLLVPALRVKGIVVTINV